MVKFVDVSLPDLVRATQFLHYVKPCLQDKVVYAMEEPKPYDQNVVFHLMGKNNDNSDICMLSAQYIIEHPYWRELND